MIEYYERDDAVLEAKWKHMDYVDAHYSSREARILETTLRDADTVLERNPFPYRTPPNVQHWTLWSVHEMSEKEIAAFVGTWLQQEMPQARCWNYDDNPQRSIDLFHVHVYIDVTTQDKRPTSDHDEVEMHSQSVKRAKLCDGFGASQTVACS